MVPFRRSEGVAQPDLSAFVDSIAPTKSSRVLENPAADDPATTFTSLGGIQNVEMHHKSQLGAPITKMSTFMAGVRPQHVGGSAHLLLDTGYGSRSNTAMFILVLIVLVLGMRFFPRTGKSRLSSVGKSKRPE